MSHSRIHSNPRVGTGWPGESHLFRAGLGVAAGGTRPWVLVGFSLRLLGQSAPATVPNYPVSRRRYMLNRSLDRLKAAEIPNVLFKGR